MRQFYIVVIVKSTDTECETGHRTANPILPQEKKTTGLKGKRTLLDLMLTHTLTSYL